MRLEEVKAENEPEKIAFVTGQHSECYHQSCDLTEILHCERNKRSYLN